MSSVFEVSWDVQQCYHEVLQMSTFCCQFVTLSLVLVFSQMPVWIKFSLLQKYSCHHVKLNLLSSSTVTKPIRNLPVCSDHYASNVIILHMLVLCVCLAIYTWCAKHLPVQQSNIRQIKFFIVTITKFINYVYHFMLFYHVFFVFICQSQSSDECSKANLQPCAQTM